MKPIIVNLPTFTVGSLNDNADYCINVRKIKLYSKQFSCYLDCRKILL
jgi:hypothetical protein